MISSLLIYCVRKKFQVQKLLPIHQDDHFKPKKNTTKILLIFSSHMLC